MKITRYILRTYQKGRVVSKHLTHSPWRFFKFLKAISFTELKKNKPFHIYLRIDYGKYEDVWGKIVPFYNSGSYTTYKDLWQAVRAFKEK